MINLNLTDPKLLNGSVMRSFNLSSRDPLYTCSKFFSAIHLMFEG